MKKNILLLTIIWLTTSSWLSLQAQDYVWAKRMGSTDSDAGRDIAVDASGNVYTTGLFGGTVDFDPGAGTFNLTSAGVSDIFVSKLDASGNFVWAKSMGGATSIHEGYGIALDGSGNVYTTGLFGGTVDFDPGAGTYNLTSAGYYNIFVSKLDASGNFVWAKGMGSTSFAVGYDIVIDGSGNVYTTGYFRGTVDFDPGASTANLISAGGRDIFVSKLDASGNFVWAKRMGGATGHDEGYGIAIDGSGNVYTTGYFHGTVDFDPGVGTANLTTASSFFDIFVSKLDASGNFVWAKGMGSTVEDERSGIALDGSGNVYTTGTFYSTADFDPGAGTFNLTPAGLSDIFVSKLDASGNFVWAKRMGSTDSDEGYSIALDGSGNVYTTGYFEGTADFDPGVGTYNLSGLSYGDIFVSKLDASGNFIWAKGMGSILYDLGHSIAIDGSGNVYTTGLFEFTVDFDMGAGTANLTSAGGNDIFITKYTQSVATPAPEINLKQNTTSIANAGTHTFGAFTVSQSSGNITFTIENSGNATLNLTGTPKIVKSGTNASDFTITETLPASINASGSATFTISFTPSGTGTRTAQISIANNDGDENPYIINLSGTGNAATAPEINLKQNTTSIVSAGTHIFGAFTVSQSSGNITFTIENTGDATLNLTGSPKIVKSGTNASDFTITETLPATINASATANFTISFTPSGTRTAQISIANNDGDENPYIINLSGTGNAASALAAPSALNAVQNTTAKGAILTWTDNSSTESGFKIERKTGTTGTFAEIATVSANVVTYTDTEASLAIGSTYCYRVRAYIASPSDNSAYSNEPCVTLLITAIEDNLLSRGTTIYPNPSDGIFNLKVETPKSSKLTYRILDNKGGVLQEGFFQKQGTVLESQIQLKGVSKGLYVIELTDEDGNQMRRKVVIAP
jgi:hypothetical protein